MKILGIFPAYEPAWAFGGVVRSTSTLFRAMADLGADVSVYTTNADGAGGFLPVCCGRPTIVGGVSVTYFRSTFGRGSVWDSRQMVRTLRESVSEFDILYTSANWQLIGISAARTASKHGVPYVMGAHGSYISETFREGRLKKQIYWQLLLKRCVAKARALHFTTEYEKRASSWLISDYPTFVVPNAVSHDCMAAESVGCPSVRAEYGILSDRILLLTVMRPDPVKRLDITLRALREIIATVPELMLVTVGDCDNRYGNRMKNLARTLGVLDHTIWVGHREGAELWSWYKECDLFVLISDHENFSMVTAEAMTAGLPVIVSSTVGLADHVRQYHTGLVCDVDAEAVADAVLGLLGDRKRLHHAGQAARNLAREFYAGEKTARCMLQAFQEILSVPQSLECASQ